MLSGVWVDFPLAVVSFVSSMISSPIVSNRGISNEQVRFPGFHTFATDVQ